MPPLAIPPLTLDVVSALTQHLGPEFCVQILHHGDAPDGSWLLEMDVLFKYEEQVTVHTCQTSLPLREESYLDNVRWTQRLATRFHVEVLRVNQQEPRVACLWFSQTIPSLLSLRGLAVPWCYRRALTQAVREIAAWWQ